MKKFSLGACIALCALTAAVTVSLTYTYAMDTFNEKVADVNERQAMYNKLSEIDQTIRQNYVGDIDEAALTDGICTGYLGGLGDADSKYFSAEQYKTYLASTSDTTIGVGITTVKDEDGNMEITEVAPNSPAEKAGLKKGDVIVAVDGKEVVRITYPQALSQLSGEKGTMISFTVIRPAEETAESAVSSEETAEESSAETSEEASEETGEESEAEESSQAPDAEQVKPQVLTIEVTREQYARSSVTYSVINQNVGYIRIAQFQNSTDEQFKTALRTLENQNVCGIVIDLRNNAGGNMESAAEIMDVLLPAGKLVSSRTADGTETVEFTSGADEVNLPISVIINENTYGAAELLAANVKEFKKGYLVGQKSAGSGRKSQVVALSDGSAVLFPVAQYLTLNGTSFDGVGITPDVPKALGTDEMNAYLSGELAPEEDSQIRSAVTALVRQGAEVGALPGGKDA